MATTTAPFVNEVTFGGNVAYIDVRDAATQEAAEAAAADVMGNYGEHIETYQVDDYWLIVCERA